MESQPAVFKQDSDFQAWWYPLILPYEHYVPIASDMNHQNITAALRWAQENDALARQIAARGQAAVMHPRVRDESVTGSYMCTLLEQYQDLLSRWGWSGETGDLDASVRRWGTA